MKTIVLEVFKVFQNLNRECGLNSLRGNDDPETTSKLSHITGILMSCNKEIEIPDDLAEFFKER